MSAGAEIPTMDKQIVRDYVESIGWNKVAPAPTLPTEVIEKTAAQYRKMQDIILTINTPYQKTAQIGETRGHA
jgi:phosphoribosylaminoimidazole-succinocarboxamide synthase